MAKKIGLELSSCLGDIMLGCVRLEDVQKIFVYGEALSHMERVQSPDEFLRCTILDNPSFSSWCYNYRRRHGLYGEEKSINQWIQEVVTFLAPKLELPCPGNCWCYPKVMPRSSLDDSITWASEKDTILWELFPGA